MVCQQCEADALRVTHAFNTPGGRSQRLECLECLAVHTAVVMILNSEPVWGQGAAALAERLKEGKVKINVQF